MVVGQFGWNASISSDAASLNSSVRGFVGIRLLNLKSHLQPTQFPLATLSR